MRHTTPNNTPRVIKEGLAGDISSQFLHCLFIDLFPLATRKGGLLSIMFPNVNARKMNRWLGDLPESETYAKNADRLKSIARRFSANATLKSLYRVVSSLKTKETSDEENPARIQDIELVMSKIQRIIKSRLTPEEQQLFMKLSAELTDAANNASKSIEGSVGASTIKPEKPTGEPAEVPEEEPEEVPEEEPTEEEPVEEPAEEEPVEEPTKETPPAEIPPAPSPSGKVSPVTQPTGKTPVGKTPPPVPPTSKGPTGKTPPPAEKPAGPKVVPPAKEKPVPPKKEVPPMKQKPTVAKPQMSQNPSGEEEEEEKKEESIQKEIFEARLKALIKEIVRERLGL